MVFIAIITLKLRQSSSLSSRQRAWKPFRGGMRSCGGSRERVVLRGTLSLPSTPSPTAHLYSATALRAPRLFDKQEGRVKKGKKTCCTT